MRAIALIVVICCTGALSAQEKNAGQQEKNPYKKIDGDARLNALRHAQVWTPVDVAAADLKSGPAGVDGFPVGAEVRCDYKEEKLSGTPKFNCTIAPDDTVRVKYGARNGEVYAEVAATRLLRALGFGADAVFPVTVVCNGCPEDPIRNYKKVEGTRTFAPAIVERKFAGDEMELFRDSGWEWVELTFVDPAVGGAPPAHREALKLLAAFLQHTDTKRQQQRLVCLDRQMGKNTGEDATCEHPFMLINDLGKTFGAASTFNGDSKSAVNFREWSTTPVWKEKSGCVANLPKSFTGSLEHPKISEAGRKFLSDRLAQLTDDQLRDLFEVAQFTRRDPGTTVEQWVTAFKKKREEIASRSCAEPAT